MAKMTVTRNYWVDWICAFDKYPTQKEIGIHKKFVRDYIAIYLSGFGKTRAIPEIELWDRKQIKWNRLAATRSATSKKLDVDDQLFIKQAMKIPSSYWNKILKVEWEQLGSKPMLFAFRAYFEDNNRRYTETRSSMTPPQPPPPPGSSQS